MKLAFTKMQGAGNDFVVIDGVTQAVDLSMGQVKRIADRRRGIGCDQILLLTPPEDPDADFRYTIYNCLLYTSPSPRDRTRSRMPSSA